MADTFAATYVSATAVKAGEAAARLAANKRDKYEEITHTHLFCPIAVETMGPVEEFSEGRDLLSAIGHLITKIGDPRETFSSRSDSLSSFSAEMPPLSEALSHDQHQIPSRLFRLFQ